MSISASVSGRSFGFLGPPLHPLCRPKKFLRKFKTTLAKKESFDEKAETQKPFFPLRLSEAFLIQSAAALFGLGFIDAGYSGDWSRIGVISRETEELLKTGAYLIEDFFGQEDEVTGIAEILCDLNQCTRNN